MFNARKFFAYLARIALAALVILGGLFVVSLIAVSVATVNYNQPIIVKCPTGIGGDNVASASDRDGKVSTASVTSEPVGSTIDTPSLLPTQQETTERTAGVALSDVMPAAMIGGTLTTKLHVLDTTPEGFYNITLTFSNDDVPVAQTATCVLNVQVTKARQADETVSTTVSIQRITEPRVATDLNALVRQFTLNVGGGMLPGIIAIVTAALLCINFISTLYGLDTLGEGGQFLNHRIFGRIGFRPFLIIGGGAINVGIESVKKRGGPAGIVLRQDSAIILDTWGTLTRIIRGPQFVQLKPFEKIWDMIDLRPQRWPFKVSAITKDGIPISYEVAIKFRVGPEDDDILKAATCKWIREAWRTEPDRVMDWVKRVILSATEGTMRNKILAQYDLDALLEPSTRQKMRQDLFKLLKDDAAEDFGVEIMEVTLHDVMFEGQVLEEWAKTWKMQRDLAVAKIEADERLQEMGLRERAQNQVRQELLDSTLQTLRALADKDGNVPTDYALLSFIDMVEHTAAEQKVFIPEDNLARLDKIKKRLR